MYTYSGNESPLAPTSEFYESSKVLKMLLVYPRTDAG